MKLFSPIWANVIKPGQDRAFRLLVAAVVALVIGLFLLELQVPVDVEVWLPNVAAVLLSLWFPYRWQTYLTTLICSILTILGLFFSPYIVRRG